MARRTDGSDRHRRCSCTAFGGARRVRAAVSSGGRAQRADKLLLRRVGVVDQSALPDLADEARALLSTMTSRQVEKTLQLRQGFRPPSRTTLQNRLGGPLEDMSTTAREPEEQCWHGPPTSRCTTPKVDRVEAIGTAPTQSTAPRASPREWSTTSCICA